MFVGKFPELRTLLVYKMISININCLNEHISEWLTDTSWITLTFLWMTHHNDFWKEMATHSSTLAWKIPWTEEPGRLQSMGSQRVGHNWVTSLHLNPFISCMIQASALDDTTFSKLLSCSGENIDFVSERNPLFCFLSFQSLKEFL